jgi:hypothetical protein
MRANIDRSDDFTGSLVTDPAGGYRPPVSPEHRAAEVEADALLASAEDRPDVVCLCSRLTAGLGVQLLTTRDEPVRAFITLTLDGQTETFEIDPSTALDAFQHPFAYGGTLL